MTGGLLGDRSLEDIILLTQGGTVREWSEVLDQDQHQQPDND